MMKKYLKYIPFLLLTIIVTASSFFAIKQANEAFVQASANIADMPVLIIDAGHGGEDGGAVSLSGVPESEINLGIALKMQDICALFGVSPVMTRESEEIDYPDSAKSISQMKKYDQKRRVELINNCDNAVLISIHQNKFPSKKPFGSQVLYANTDKSADFGKHTQEILINSLNNENYRTAAQIQDTIYLMKNISCPAILIECGFLSNPEEEQLLLTENYRLKMALTIASAYFTYDFEPSQYTWLYTGDMFLYES